MLKKTNNFTNLSIDNNDINNIDNIDGSKYGLNEKYFPNNEESYTAFDICNKLNDQKNFAFYIATVKRLGISKSRILLHETLEDVNRCSNSNKPIKNPAALFNWKVSKQS